MPPVGMNFISHIRSRDGLDVLQAARRFSREELDGLQAQGESNLDVARIGRAGADRDADLLAVLDGGRDSGPEKR